MLVVRRRQTTQNWLHIGANVLLRRAQSWISTRAIKRRPGNSTTRSLASTAQEEILRAIRYVAGIAIAACLTSPSKAQRPAPPANEGAVVTVRMSNFAFTPDHLRLKVGVPMRLRLVNESGGGHDFSAPGFFAASRLPSGSPVPPDGAVAIGSHRTVEIAVEPRIQGVYRLECTHFLHSFFGMHGTIEVDP
jgi:plastocyanin